ncbi:hypothetical protein Ancab_001649, partial [Ancistrocladus abbreviatus]
MGTLSGIDHNTSYMERFNVARILISTVAVGELINESITAKIDENCFPIYSSLALNVCSSDFSEPLELAVTVDGNAIRLADDVNGMSLDLGAREVEAFPSSHNHEVEEGTSNTQQELAAENHDDVSKQMHVYKTEFNEERRTKGDMSNELKSLEHVKNHM